MITTFKLDKSKRSMLSMFKYMVVIVLLAVTSCKNGNPVEVKSYSFLEVEMVALPGTPTLAVYLENIKQEDSLKSGGTVGLGARPIILLSDKKTKVSFRKKGSDEMLLDTSIFIPSGEKVKLRIAFSEDLGIKGFLKYNGNISLDFASVQLYNRLPMPLQADSWKVDLILYEYDPVAGDIKELTVFQDFRRNKLHPKSVLLPIRKNNEDITYLVGLKNVETNQLITDVNGTDLIMLRLNPGKEQITTILDSKMDNGDGTFSYMFTTETADL